MSEFDLWPLLAIVALFALNIVIPGANFVWISRMSLDHGRFSGWSTSLGSTAGDLLYTLLALAGLTSLVAKQPLALPLVGLLGGLWLALLGARMMFTPSKITLNESESAEHKPWPFMKAFRAGFLVNLTNPQSLVFFSAMLVSGMPEGVSVDEGVFLMVGLILVSLAIRGGIAALFATERVRATYASLRRPMSFLSGGTLLFFGVKTAWHVAPFWASHAKALALALPVFV